MKITLFVAALLVNFYMYSYVVIKNINNGKLITSTHRRILRQVQQKDQGFDVPKLKEPSYPGCSDNSQLS